MRIRYLYLSWAALVFVLTGDLHATDSTDIKKSFDAATVIKLGTYQDIREITAAIKRDDPGMNVVEVRWFSPTAVIVRAVWQQNSPKVGTYFYILKNEPTGWRVTERNLFSVL